MQFRRATSFNTHDSKRLPMSKTENGRTTVVNGVRKRCELVLNALIRSDSPMALGQIVSELQERFSETYSSQDISYALGRLVTNRLVTRRGHGSSSAYRATNEARAKWRATVKQYI